ncbi:hypothetical protein ACLK15_07530 [Escherichia coli]
MFSSQKRGGVAPLRRKVKRYLERYPIMKMSTLPTDPNAVASVENVSLSASLKKLGRGAIPGLVLPMDILGAT